MKPSNSENTQHDNNVLPYYNTSGGNATAFYYQPPVPNGGVQQESTFSWTGFIDVRVDNWYLYLS